MTQALLNATRSATPAHAVRLLFGAALLAASSFSQAALVSVTATGTDEFVMAPTWRAVDFNLFTAATGVLPAAEILVPATHLDRAGLGIDPGEPHPAPYDFELSDALFAAGLIDEFEFAERDFDGSNGQAIYFAFNIIADEDHAPTGMTPDGEQAMLPLDLFALEVSATLSRTFHALPAEPLAEYLIVLDAPDPDLFPEFTLEGMSHLPFFFAIDPSVLPAGVPAAGDFRLQFVLRDAGGNGYRLESAFALLPVPAAGTTPLLALCVAGLPFLRRPRHVAGGALRRE